MFHRCSPGVHRQIPFRPKNFNGCTRVHPLKFVRFERGISTPKDCDSALWFPTTEIALVENQKGATVIDFFFFSDSALPVLRGTSLKSVDALLALKWRYWPYEAHSTGKSLICHCCDSAYWMRGIKGWIELLLLTCSIERETQNRSMSWLLFRTHSSQTYCGGRGLYEAMGLFTKHLKADLVPHWESDQVSHFQSWFVLRLFMLHCRLCPNHDSSWWTAWIN